MPRSRKPERYPAEFFDLLLHAQREGGVEVPTETLPEAFGLRQKLLAFFNALDGGREAGVEALARRLLASQRLPSGPDGPASTTGEGWAWAISCASNLLGAAADFEVRVESTPTPRLILAPRSENKFARIVRRALDAKRPSVEESLGRLKDLLKGDENV